MTHPLHGRRLSQMRLAEIRKILAETPPDEAVSAQLLRDSRAGVQKLALPAPARKSRETRRTSRHEEMLAFERNFLREEVAVIAGVDEAGRGPLAGPVTAGCVILPENTRFPGLDDSKRMTPRAREEVYDRIIHEARAWSVAVISHLDIDELGILGAALKGMRVAVRNLGITPDLVLVDGNVLPGLPCRERAIVGGDGRCLSIAAASVIAKVTRDRIMIELDGRYPGYGFAGHKGYAAAEHVAAIRSLGPSDIHRFSFHTSTTVAPPGTVRRALEQRFRSAGTLSELESAAAGVRRNSRFFEEADLDHLRGVFRECREQFSGRE